MILKQIRSPFVSNRGELTALSPLLFDFVEKSMDVMMVHMGTNLFFYRKILIRTRAYNLLEN